MSISENPHDSVKKPSRKKMGKFNHNMGSDTVKINSEEFYANGGFSNPNQFRKQEGSGWAFYRYKD